MNGIIRGCAQISQTATQWPSQISPFNFVVPINNCSAQRHLMNRQFDRTFGRDLSEHKYHGGRSRVSGFGVSTREGIPVDAAALHDKEWLGVRRSATSPTASERRGNTLKGLGTLT